MAPEEIDVGEHGLVLRRLWVDDAARLFAAVEPSIAELRMFMPWAAENPTLQAVTAYLERVWDPPATFGYGLYDGTGEVVGAFGLHARRGPGILEIGYWVRSDRTGRGYATASARALAVAALEHFADVDRIEIRCDPANLASGAIPRKLDFRLDRVDEAPIEAAAQTGKQQVWVKTRTP